MAPSPDIAPSLPQTEIGTPPPMPELNVETLTPPPESLAEGTALENDIENFTNPNYDPIKSIEGLATEPTSTDATPLPQNLKDKGSNNPNQPNMDSPPGTAAAVRETLAPERSIQPDASQERINTYVDKQMKEWEANNKAPDRDTDPNAYEQWQSERVAHMEQMETQAQFHEDIRAWEDAHPEPQDNPTAHRKWLKDREAHKQELKSAQEAQNPTNEQGAQQKDQDAENKKETEAEKALEDPKNQEKIKRLQELYQKRAALLGNEIALKQTQQQAEKAKQDATKIITELAENRGNIEKVETEIKQLEAELKLNSTQTGSLFKKILTVIALIGAGGAVMAAQGARQA